MDSDHTYEEIDPPLHVDWTATIVIIPLYHARDTDQIVLALDYNLKIFHKIFTNRTSKTEILQMPSAIEFQVIQKFLFEVFLAQKYYFPKKFFFEFVKRPDVS